jgi:ERF superfamily
MNEAVKINPDIELPPAAGTSVAMREEVALVADDGFLQMIERASRDPTVDVAKFKELMAMRTEHEDRQASRMFDLGMNEAQAQMKAVAADAKNPATNSKYATYPALDAVLRPIYTTHGFSLSFNTAKCDIPDAILVTCRVSKGGHSRDYEIPMPADGKGARGADVMTKTHATGSAVSYGMRYLLKMIFNIAVDSDDDGNKASADNSTISAKQIEAIRKLIVESGADIKRFCDYAKVERVEDIPARHFKAACNMLEKKKKAAKGKRP